MELTWAELRAERLRIEGEYRRIADEEGESTQSPRFLRLKRFLESLDAARHDFAPNRRKIEGWPPRPSPPALDLLP